MIHFAGYKAVGESVAKPIEYYSNNIGNTLTLVDVMRGHGCKSIIFSSSATVYGDPDSLPLTEESPKKMATNPYGWTKWMIEQMLTRPPRPRSRVERRAAALLQPHRRARERPHGRGPQGHSQQPAALRGTDRHRQARGRARLGDDYPTPDGTGVRDYIHVCDLPPATPPHSRG